MNGVWAYEKCGMIPKAQATLNDGWRQWLGQEPRDWYMILRMPVYTQVLVVQSKRGSAVNQRTSASSTVVSVWLKPPPLNPQLNQAVLVSLCRSCPLWSGLILKTTSEYSQMHEGLIVPWDPRQSACPPAESLQGRAWKDAERVVETPTP